MQLQREIGLKSFRDVGLSDLGIRAIKVELKQAGIFPEIRVSSIT